MSEWTRQPIKDLIDSQWPGEWGSEHNPYAPSVVVYRSTDIDDEGHLLEDDGGVYRSLHPQKINSKKLLPGDILLEASGGAPDRPVGRVALFSAARGELSVCANFLRTLRPKKSVCSEYLKWALYSLHRQSAIWRYQQQTTGIINLKVADYLNHLIDLPPLPQQRRIAEILSTLDEAIEQTEALIAKMQQVKAGLMHDLFTRGVTPDGLLRPSREQAPELYKESPIGWIPKEWEGGKLEQYLDPISGIKPGPFGSSLTKDTYISKGYKIYGQEQVIAGSLEVGDYYISEAKFRELATFEVLSGDVLMSLVGTVGCVLVVTPPFEQGIINPRLMRLRPARDVVSPDFLKYLLLSANVRRQLDILAGGGTMPVINGKIVRRLFVPLLSYDEQVKVASRINTLEDVISITIEIMAKLGQQKRGLMHNLLSGVVAVS